MGATTIVLARHGRTPWHHGNRYAGSTDIGLDDEGERQARSLAVWARHNRPDALYSSTMLRARQTMEPVAAALGMTPGTDGRLREIHFGQGEGHTLDELRVDHPEAVEGFLRDAAANPLPGGEDPHEVARRGAAAVDELVARHPGETVLVICHSTLIRLVVCHYTGMPLRGYRTVLKQPAPTSLTRLVHQGAGVMLDGYNIAAVVSAADVGADAAAPAAGTDPQPSEGSTGGQAA